MWEYEHPQSWQVHKDSLEGSCRSLFVHVRKYRDAIHHISQFNKAHNPGVVLNMRFNPFAKSHKRYTELLEKGNKLQRDVDEALQRLHVSLADANRHDHEDLVRRFGKYEHWFSTIQRSIYYNCFTQKKAPPSDASSD